MRRIWSVICFSLWLVGLSQWAQAQAITVRNFLNPDAPVVREALTLVEGEGLTTVEEADPFGTPNVLGGVRVMLDGVPQRIRSVSPTRVVFIVDAAGAASRTLVLHTQANATFQTQITLVNAWPGVFVQSTGEDSESYIPSGLWTPDVNQPQLRPLTSEPILIGPFNRPTLVILQGTGWRYAAAVRVRLNGIPCQVVSAKPSGLFPGQDELAFQVPAYLINYGPVDVIVSVAGRESNYSRILLGEAAN
jgi:uncharacterized protein (TIGR03437 family)